MTSIRIVAVLLLAVALAACHQDTASLPPPHEPGPADVGVMCHMNLSEHGGPKGQVFLKGKESEAGQPLWFSSVRDTFTWLLMDDGLDASVSAVWVNDMGRARNWNQPDAGAWVEAHKALFVVGSDSGASMGGGELVPFAERRAADSFIALHGGQVVDFKQVDRALLDRTGASK